MPRNDRSDSLSVRGDDDPRRTMRELNNESERELLDEEKHETGGPAHRGPGEREGGRGAREPSPDVEEYAREVRRATDEQERDPGDAAPGGGDRTRGA